MKSTLFILIVGLVAALSACSVKKDAEVKSFIADVDQVAIDITRAVDEKPETGVDVAQQLLDKRKADLKTKYDKLKLLRGYELSDDVSKRFVDSVAKNVETVNGLRLKYAEEAAEDEKLGQKLVKLSNDFNSIFGV